MCISVLSAIDPWLLEAVQISLDATSRSGFIETFATVEVHKFNMIKCISSQLHVLCNDINYKTARTEFSKNTPEKPNQQRFVNVTMLNKTLLKLCHLFTMRCKRPVNCWNIMSCFVEKMVHIQINFLYVKHTFTWNNNKSMNKCHQNEKWVKITSFRWIFGNGNCEIVFFSPYVRNQMRKTCLANIKYVHWSILLFVY